MTIAPVSFSRYSRDFDGFARDLGDSFARHGFAVLSDHEIPAGVIADALAASKGFFALPETVKAGAIVEGAGGQRGYTAFGVEKAKDSPYPDLKEFWHVGRELPPGHPYARVMAPNVWPAAPEGFREASLRLYEALEALGLKILRAIARRLELEPDYFEAPARFGNSILRLLHYPAGPFDGPELRAGAHEDINAITLLLGAEEAGLQILGRDGAWLDVNPPEGAVVCNIGDMLQRLTNGVLPSTTHRVLNPAPERRASPRYSMPFFLHFAPDFVIETLPSCVGPGRPDPHLPPITAQDYLEERLREIGLRAP